VKKLTLDEILMFHRKILKKTGGRDGLRDKSLLESAINQVGQTFDGKDLYPTVIDKISVMTYSLISNHAFVDGNKRIGIAVMIITLKINFIKVSYTQEELIELGLGVASGKFRERDIASWIEEHILKKE
jgi:death-on-curing protein